MTRRKPDQGPWVWRPGKGMVPKYDAEPLPARGVRLGNAPMVQGDYLDKPTRHMATGKTHESKSAFRQDTKNSGCVELGTDAPRSPPKPEFKNTDVRVDLHRNWDRISSR